jgi:hypothetical protein
MVVLNDLQEEAINNAIMFVHEVGYKDRNALLVEAMCALSSIETVMALAKKEKDLPKQIQFK